MRGSGKEKLIRAAVKLFGNEGLEDVSIAQITRKARVSNSTFYKYFKGKQSLITEIFEFGIKLLDENLRVRGFTPESRLHRLIEDYVFFVEENTEICKILHEAELTFQSLPKKVKTVLMRKTEEAGLKPSDEIFWLLWGSVRFLSMWIFFWKNEAKDTIYTDLMKFIKSGIDPNDHNLDVRVFNINIPNVEIDLDTTKAKLLAASEKLFAEKGFRDTQISDITKEAGVGLGTFYIYFQTKLQALQELLQRINSALRYSIKLALSDFNDRRDAEIAGYCAFLNFFKTHKGVYRIVRDAEFIIPEHASLYYKRLHQSYISPLKKALEKGEIREYDPSSLAIFLMGIGHFMGEDLLLVKRSKDFKSPLRKLSDLLFHGLGG